MLSVEMEAATEREKREHRKLAWHTWHIAALGRVEKMPDLADFIGVKQKPKTAEELDHAMQAFAAAFSGRA